MVGLESLANSDIGSKQGLRDQRSKIVIYLDFEFSCDAVRKLMEITKIFKCQSKVWVGPSKIWPVGRLPATIFRLPAVVFLRKFDQKHHFSSKNRLPADAQRAGCQILLGPVWVFRNPLGETRDGSIKRVTHSDETHDSFDVHWNSIQWCNFDPSLFVGVTVMSRNSTLQTLPIIVTVSLYYWRLSQVSIHAFMAFQKF